jgi:isoquinoline 1-oxidoreductase beta subunit
MPMAAAPERIEVHMIPSTVSPVGCGKMGIPTAAPALTNAIFAACSVRLRNLPVREQLREAVRKA